MSILQNENKLKSHTVRLFPSLKNSSEREAELRATAALLAMAKAVSEFGRQIVKLAGGPAGRLECFTEVEIELDGGRLVRPDGFLRTTRGSKQWMGFLETKVGSNEISTAQFTDYLEAARLHGVDAVITVSNQVALPNGLPPIKVDNRKLRGIKAIHLSWERILSDAQILSRMNGIQDQDQLWMMNQWIKYILDPRSRIIETATLGKHWSSVLDAAKHGNLSSVVPQIEDVVTRWDEFLRRIALSLRSNLGVDVKRHMTRSDREDYTARIRRLRDLAIEERALLGNLRVPGAAGDIALSIDLHGQSMKHQIIVEAPREGRATTRVKWLTRQLGKMQSVPPRLLIRIDWDKRSVQSQCYFQDLSNDAEPLLKDIRRAPIPKDAVPRRFILEWTKDLKRIRAKSGASILEMISRETESFYQRVVEGLKPYTPAVPKFPTPKAEEAEAKTAEQILPPESSSTGAPESLGESQRDDGESTTL